MATVRKKISELTPLNSASLDTTLLGIDNGTTYKIELDTLADAVTARVNILDRDRLSSLESVTSSFETKGRSILSGSVSYTSLTNIPQGIVSQSTDLTSLNQFTASISTASLVTSINNLNTFTASQSTSSLVNRLNAIESVSGSWITENETGSFLTSLNGAISSSSQLTSSYDTRYVISGSITQTTWDNIASKPSDIVSSSAQITAFGFISSSQTVDTASFVTTSSFNPFSSSVNSRLNSLEGGIATGSVNFVQKLGTRVVGVTTTDVTIISESITTSGNPVQIIITGDAHPLQGSGQPSYTDLQIFRNNTPIGNVVTVQNERFNNVAYCLNFIDSISAGTHTYSMRTTGSLYGILDFGEVSGPTITIVELNSQTSFEGTTLISGSSQLTSSLDTRYAASGSAPTLFLLEAYANETYTLPGGFTDDTCRYSIVNNTVNVPSNWFNTSTYTFTPLKAGYWEITAEYDVYRGSGVEASIAIKKNGGVVAAVGSFGAVSQLVTKIVYLNGSTDYINIINVGNVSNSRGQFDGRSWFQARWIGE